MFSSWNFKLSRDVRVRIEFKYKYNFSISQSIYELEDISNYLVIMQMRNIKFPFKQLSGSNLKLYWSFIHLASISCFSSHLVVLFYD